MVTFSVYVPMATLIVSLAGAALTAAWIEVHGRVAEPLVTPVRLRRSTNVVGAMRDSGTSRQGLSRAAGAWRGDGRAMRQRVGRYFQNMNAPWVALLRTDVWLCYCTWARDLPLRPG